MKKAFLSIILTLIAISAIDAKVVKYKNGDVYDGEWSKRAPNGHGTMTYANGDKYEGNWVNGLQTGEGVFTYSNGGKYTGSWLDGKKSGKGLFEYPDGSIYDGNWEEDLQSGEGSFTSASGDCYQGSWKIGMKDGEGTYSRIGGNGIVEYDGKWSHDALVDGVVTDSNYSFSGQFSVSLSPEKGKLVYKKGETEFYFDGTFSGSSNDLSKVVLKTGTGYFPHEGGLFKGTVLDGHLSKGEFVKGVFSDYDYLILDNVWMNGNWRNERFFGSYLITSRDGGVLLKGSSSNESMNGTIHSMNLKSGNIHYFTGLTKNDVIISGNGYLLPSDKVSVEVPFSFVNTSCAGDFSNIEKRLGRNNAPENPDVFYTHAVEYFERNKKKFLKDHDEFIKVKLTNLAGSSTDISYDNDVIGSGRVSSTVGSSLASFSNTAGKLCGDIVKTFNDTQASVRDAFYNSHLKGIGFYKELHLTDFDSAYSLLKGEGVAIKITAFFTNDGRIYFAVIGFRDVDNLPANVEVNDRVINQLHSLAMKCRHYAKYYPYSVKGNTLRIEISSTFAEYLEYDSYKNTLRWDKYGVTLDTINKSDLVDYLVRINYLSRN